MFAKPNGRKKWLLMIPAVLILAAVIVFAVRIDRKDDASAEAGTSPTWDSIVRENSAITVAGKEYTLDPDMETVLFIGVDDFGAVESSEFYFNDGQADFLMLAVVNHREQTYRMLHINRDTMTEVTMLGLGGREAGTDTMQIALAHSYGSGLEDSCKNTAKAVSGLLYGAPVDSYLSMNMDGVGLLADAVDGVTLECLDDFQGHPDLYKGNVVTLRGEEALVYVRGRGGVGDETNLNRMERQKQFIDKFLDKFMASAGDVSFSLHAVESVSEYLCSDMTIQSISDTAGVLSDYTCTEVLSITGDAIQGSEFMEYYPDETALQKQVIDLLCSAD